MKTIKSSCMGGAVLAGLLAMGANSTAYASSYTMTLNYAYGPSGYTLASAGPLTATFTDGTGAQAGDVLLTLNASSMSASDYVLAWNFNINQPGLLGDSHLVFTPQSSLPLGMLGGSQTPFESPNSSQYAGDSGKYLFDIELGWATGTFVGGDTETYVISQNGGTGTLAASDFVQLSTTLSPYGPPYSETQPFMTTADIHANSGPGYNWLGGSVPDGGATAMLLGMGMLGIGSARRFLKK